MDVRGAEFYIYGYGPLKSRLEDDAAAMGVPVHMMGWSKDYPSEVAKLDLLVYELPIDSYASSELAVQGAMAAEVPIVILPSLGTRWLIQHNETGLVAENREELIEYTNELWHDPRRARILATRAKEKALADYGTHNQVKAYQRLYAELLAK